MRGTEEGGLAGEGAALAPLLRPWLRAARASAASAGASRAASPSRCRDLARKVFLGGKGVENRSRSDLGERAQSSRAAEANPQSPPLRGRPPPGPAGPASPPVLRLGVDLRTMACRLGPRPPGAVVVQPLHSGKICCIHPPNRAGFFFWPQAPCTGVAF